MSFLNYNRPGIFFWIAQRLNIAIRSDYYMINGSNYSVPLRRIDGPVHGELFA